MEILTPNNIAELGLLYFIWDQTYHHFSKILAETTRNVCLLKPVNY